jgi:hypothetical protein
MNGPFRLARYESDIGGILLPDPCHVEVLQPHGVRVARARVPDGWTAADLIDDYRVCELFPDFSWYIGVLFQRTIHVEVYWKQKFHDCSGDIRIEGINRAPTDPAIWSWSIEFDEELQDFIVDSCFPVERHHPERDIVLRRKIASALLEHCLADEVGEYRVVKGDRFSFTLDNVFTGRPHAANRRPWLDMFAGTRRADLDALDIYAARKAAPVPSAY